MSILKIVLRWLFGLYALLFFFLQFSKSGSSIAAILFLICSAFLTPPTLTFVEDKIKIKIPTIVKFLVVIFSFFLGTLFYTYNYVIKNPNKLSQTKPIKPKNKDIASTKKPEIEPKKITEDNVSTPEVTLPQKSIKIGTMYTVRVSGFAATSDEIYDEIFRMSSIKDELGIRTLVSQNLAVLLYQGQEVFISDIHFSNYEVRVKTGKDRSLILFIPKYMLQEE